MEGGWMASKWWMNEVEVMMVDKRWIKSEWSGCWMDGMDGG